MNMIAKGIKWLADKQAVHASVKLKYCQGEQTFKMVGWLGHTKVEKTDERGFRLTSHVSDFLIRTKDLPVTPTPGDEIFMNGFRYEVLELSNDAGCWCWSDSFQTIYRVHVKYIGEASHEHCDTNCKGGRRRAEPKR